MTKDPARPDPLAAAQRVKELARDLALEVADGYRKSTRYFKLRAAVIGSWALLSVLTVWLTCPSQGNALGAEVHLSLEDPLQTQVLVSNTSGDIWTDVVLTLDGTWRFERKTLRDGEKLVVATSRFVQGAASAPGDLKPRTLTIECEQGKVTAPLSAR